jgi:hypothetical protein
MNIFPITKSSDEFDDISEIIGYQVLDSKGLVIGSGETEEEAREKALLTMYLAESNEENSRKIKLDITLLRKKMVQKC